MKSLFITLLIISFLGVAVFGFVSMIFSVLPRPLNNDEDDDFIFRRVSG